jgi:hypothetical protein
MNTKTKMVIKVFGEDAKAISEGDRFLARVGSVEGRTIINLERVS